ncbi:MAG TPA: hypothetical protein DD381_10615 [Lentisphaeria bacterium]|nr:MAG: hypothetical protein A2X47_02055 [Lentisphaerae bacterium GWF2_38_69]HBM16779.1 hypothetical protein [Lentisphaeria bacterium]
MKTKNFSIRLSIKEGFRGFGKWWIPLCSVSLVILLSQSWLSNIAMKYSDSAKYLSPFYKAFKEFELEMTSIETASYAFVNLRNKIAELGAQMGSSYDFHLFAGKISTAFILIFIILCLLYIVTIIISKMSVSKNTQKIDIKKTIMHTPVMSLSYFVLCIVKVLPFSISFLIPFFFFILNLSSSTGEVSGLYVVIQWLSILFISFLIFVSGIVLYIRLYFTGFIITEESVNPFKAITKSIILTKGLFIKVGVLFIVTTIIDIVSLISVIGFIPANSIKYTLRASAYRQILDKETL